jgi:hypothetical protein
LLTSHAVTASIFDTGLNIEGERSYIFSAEFDSLALAADQSCWFSAVNTGPPNTFRWNQAIAGMDSSVSNNGFNWNRFPATGRTPLTFTLTSDSAAPVPEPASLLLVATGLAGIVARFRRRKA